MASKMTKERPYAIRACSRMLLEKAWAGRNQFWPEGITVEGFFRNAPEVIARRILEVDVEYREINSWGQNNRIAGFMDRSSRLIVIGSGFRADAQRFTLAHEIGHWMLHPQESYFRERPWRRSERQSARPIAEIEADLFAAELLMPVKAIRRAFIERFGGPIDGRVYDFELCDVLSRGVKQAIDPHEFTLMTSETRAGYFARASLFNVRFFKSLVEQFNVSSAAMAIRLVELKLVL